MTSELGERRERIRAGLAGRVELRRRPAARLLGRRRRAPTQLASMGVDEAIVFPNFGLLWERTLDADLGALDREHDRVEPLVRVGRRRRPRARCIRSRT